MAGTGYDLNVQIQLQAPSNANVASIVKQIQSQFSSAGVPINVNVNAKSLGQAAAQVQTLTNNTNAANASASTFSKTITTLSRKFGAFAVGTQILGGISSAISRTTKEAIKFETELNRIKQITGQTDGQLAKLTSTITNLSRTLGVSSSDLIEVTKTLNQAGFAAADVEKSLKVLAQTTLGSSFGSIADTTEGAIAILRQFDRQAKETGDTSKFLADSLDAINAVSKRFAVESSDIIAAVRRVGGVFSSAGGSINELIALFTSIRATTRESAETISVGLRTIFSRLQRVDTIEKLQALGIQLQDTSGQFVGPLKAIEQLAQALSSIDPRDYRISQIVEELGGIRQVGKVIPLIYQYTTAQQALQVANASGGSIAKDAALAQLTLANQFQKTGEAFADLARKFTQSSGFKAFATQMLSIANAAVQIAEALIPLIPLVTKLGVAFATVKGIGAAGAALGLTRKNSGGKIEKFARGGYVPGSGNSDTVPAMLTPGEFVIKKSSAKKLGADTLNAMNNNRFADGDEVRIKDRIDTSKDFSRKLSRINSNAVLSSLGDKDPGDKELDIVGAFLRPNDVVSRFQSKLSNRKNLFGEIKKGLGNVTDQDVIAAIGKDIKTLSVVITSGSLTESQSQYFQDGLRSAISGFASQFAGNFPGIPFNAGKFDSAYSAANLSQVEGNLFEAFISGLSNAPYDDQKINANDNFDFRNGLGSAASAFGLPGDVPGDAKRTFDKNSLGSLANKGITALVDGYRAALAQSLISQGATGGKDIQAARASAAAGTARQSLRAFANGGSVDNVPALLTPGEYVINKSAAQKIGYGNLNSMNKTGVARFAAGGAVGVKKFAAGGTATGATSGNILSGLTSGAAALTASFNSLKGAVLNSSDKLTKIGAGFQKVAIAGALGASTILQYSKTMLGLNDQQSQAAQEVIGFATIIAGAVSGLVSMVGSFGANTTSTTANTTANLANTTAVSANTAAQTGAAAVQKTTSGGLKGMLKSIDPLTAILAVATVAFTTVVGALQYNASILRQEADKSKKAFEDFITSVREGKEGSGGAAVKVREEAAANARAQAANNATTSGGFGAAGGIIAGGVAGFALGGPIGAIVGIIGGAAAAYAAAKEDERRYLSEYEQQIQANINELVAFAEATAVAAEVQANISKGLADFRKQAEAALPANATEEQRRAAEAQRVAQSANLIETQSSRINTGVTNDAFKKLQEVAQKLNKPVSLLTEQDITSDREKGILEGGPKLNPAEATAAINAIRAVAEQKSAVDAALDASRQTLQDAAQLEIDGTKTFDQLIASGGAFAQALETTKRLIEQQSELRIADLRSQRRDAVEQNNSEAIASIDAQIQAEIDARAQATQGLEESYRTSVKLSIENRARAEEEARFRTAMAQTIAQFNNLDAVLQTVENSASRVKSAINNWVAAVTDGNIQFGNQLPENFGDVTNIGDPGQFQAELDRALAPFGQVGQRLNNQITNGANILESANQVLSNMEFDVGEQVNATEILAAMGLNQANLGSEIFNKITNDIRRAAEEGGTLSEEQIQEIFAPALEESRRAAEQAKRLNAVRNNNLTVYQDFLDKLVGQFNKEISARQKVIDVELQNAEILAKAGARGEVTAQERETARTNRAQEGLAGTGLQAGDIQGAGQLLFDRLGQRAAIADRQRRGVAGPQDVRNLTQFNQEIAQATAELERLADQSDKVADIQSQIEKEQAKRNAVAGVAESFVFGGNDTREQINRGLAGIQAALQTGTVQNQSEEQRGATLSMLNQLQDIPFFKQLKKNLVASDIFRITGNAGLANAVANATPEEQRLQQELIQVTQQRTQAAMLLSQIETAKTQELINSEQQLIAALAALERAILNENAATAGQTGYASGGIIRGPGSGKSDSILANVSNGEFIVNAQATRKYRGLIEDINNGKKIPGFKNGGAGGRVRSRNQQAPQNRTAGIDVGVIGGVNGQAAGRSSGSIPRNNRSTTDGIDSPIGAGGRSPGAAGRASQNNRGYASAPDTRSTKPTSTAYTDEGLTPFPYRRKPQRASGQVNVPAGSGDFMAAMESTGDFGNGISNTPSSLPTVPAGFAESQMPAAPVPRNNMDTATGSRARRREGLQNTPYQQELDRRRDAYQTQQQQRRDFYGTAEGRMAMGRGQTGGFAFSPFNGGVAGGQMSPQQTNNMVAAASNGGGGPQQMNGMTINHNVTVQGMIAIGGLNIQSMSAGITQAVGQMVVAEVNKQLKSMNSGFRAGT